VSIWGWLDRKLSRVTSTGEYIPEIDGLRFVAILPVVILHLTYWVLKARLHAPPDLEKLKQGDGLLTLVATFGLGVPLFFVISVSF
jgi:peptidoglycan/LPS O-acetylase OafA/YrhL